VPVRGLGNATYDVSTGLRFCSNLYNFSLNKIVEAAVPVNQYENLKAHSYLQTEAARIEEYGQDTDSVDPSRAKCELGIRSRRCKSSGCGFEPDPHSCLWDVFPHEVVSRPDVPSETRSEAVRVQSSYLITLTSRPFSFFQLLFYGIYFIFKFIHQPRQ